MKTRRFCQRAVVASFAALFLSLPLLAGTPPPLPKTPPPLPVIPPGATWPDAPQLLPFNAPPFTLESLRTAVISSPLYYSTLSSLGLLKSSPSPDSVMGETVAGDETGRRLPIDTARGPLNSGAAATSSLLRQSAETFSMTTLANGVVGSSWNFTTGPGEQHQEVEPYIYTQGSSPTTVVLSQRITKPGTQILGNLWASQTNDFMSFTSGYLPMPTLNSGSVVQTTDPWLGGNPYTTGLNPGWMYATGIAFQNVAFDVPNALVLWHSTDGGKHWSTPTESGHNILVERTQNYTYDKPALAVSTNSNFLGRVYVGYSLAANGSLTQIHLARSRDGQTFDVSNPMQPLDDILIDNTSVSTGAQVVVDNTSGIIYVVYFDMLHRKMRMATVVDSASYPPQRLWVESIEDVTGTRSGLVTNTDPLLNPDVKAWSSPAAVFFWPSGRIYVTWHERAANGTDIFLAWKKLSVPADPSWSGPVQITNQANDQFMPSIDYDTNDRTLVIGYYDRSSPSSGNLYYGNSFVVWDDTIFALKVGPKSMTGTSLYNPDSTPFFSGFLGDYQSIFGWNFPSGPTHNSTYILTGSTYAVDAWATAIQ